MAFTHVGNTALSLAWISWLFVMEALVVFTDAALDVDVLISTTVIFLRPVAIEVTSTVDGR